MDPAALVTKRRSAPKALSTSNGKRIASVGADIQTIIWDAEAGEQLYKLRGQEIILSDVAFSPDGKKLAVSSWNGTVRIWDLSE